MFFFCDLTQSTIFRSCLDRAITSKASFSSISNPLRHSTTKSPGSLRLIRHAPGKHVCEMYTSLNPTFTYIAKLGFSGVYIIFLFFIHNIHCGYRLELGSPRRFKRVPTMYVLCKNIKNIKIFKLKILLFTT